MSKEEEEIKAGSETVEAKGNNGTKPQADKPKNNTVPVDRDQLAQILRDNEEFRVKIGQLESNAVSTQVGNPMMVSKKAKSVTKNLRKWDNKYVIGWVNKATRPGKEEYVYFETNKDTKEREQFIDLILLEEDGSTTTQKEKYLPYLQDSDRVTLKEIRSVRQDDEVIFHGVTYKKDFVENGYGMYETTVQVPMEETKQHYLFTLETEDGKELTISDRFVG